MQNSTLDSKNSWEYQYLNLIAEILVEGEQRGDRTGTGTTSIFGARIVANLNNGFPLVTTKKMGIKSIISELLWFLEGSQDERRLAEITHGTRDPEKKTIWSPNAEFTTGSSFKPTYQGDLGRIYGVQWRKWNKTTVKGSTDTLEYQDGSSIHFGAKVVVEQVDQIKNLIHRIKTNPTDRRLLFSAWNPGEIDNMALPPCHMFAQFYVNNDQTLSCQMYMRSCDVLLGLPYNMASYASLTMMIAQVCGLQPGKLIVVLGDAHIYSNHIEGAQRQLLRSPYDAPRLIINPEIRDIDSFSLGDFSLSDYKCHPGIKLDMAA